MGTIIRGISNNIIAAGVFGSGAINNATVASISALAQVSAGGGALVKIGSTQTASNSASISFTSGIDGTYGAYYFLINSIRAQTDATHIGVEFSTDGGSSYGLTRYEANTYANRDEGNTSHDGPSQWTSENVEGATTLGKLTRQGNDADQNGSCELILPNPGNTTRHKVYFARGVGMTHDNYSMTNFIHGMVETTSAINAVRFKFESGNIVEGTFTMYGYKKS